MSLMLASLLLVTLLSALALVPMPRFLLEQATRFWLLILPVLAA
jgi:hypothetical protein